MPLESRTRRPGLPWMRLTLVKCQRTRAMRKDHQEAACDGKVLEEHGHLHLIGRLKVVEQARQNAEASTKKSLSLIHI